MEQFRKTERMGTGSAGSAERRSEAAKRDMPNEQKAIETD
jgi:hypothetical protein